MDDSGEAERDGRGRRIVGGVVAGCGLASLLTVGGIGMVLAFLVITVPSCDLDLGNIGDPGEGKASKRLAVTVAPRTDLVDGSMVRVRSRAFAADRVVGVATCLRAADTQRKGVEACDETNGSRYAVPADGALDVPYRVARLIRVGDRVWDCGERAERCIVVAADAGDYDRSGGQTISFRPGVPAPTIEPPVERPVTDLLPVTATPAGPYRSGQTVELRITGLLPHEPVITAWCDESAGETGLIGACTPTDAGEALAAIGLDSVSSVKAHADEGGTASVSMTVRARLPEPAFGSSSLGPVDCRTKAGRCWFVVAAAADTRRSAVLPYTVTD